MNISSPSSESKQHEASGKQSNPLPAWLCYGSLGVIGYQNSGAKCLWATSEEQCTLVITKTAALQVGQTCRKRWGYVWRSQASTIVPALRTTAVPQLETFVALFASWSSFYTVRCTYSRTETLTALRMNSSTFCCCLLHIGVSLLNREDGGDMFLRNVSWLTTV
jgi:hypothetical protein